VAADQPRDGNEILTTPTLRRRLMIKSNEYTQAMTTNEIDQALQDFADAQARGDSRRLAQLLTDDFKLVGPLGFVVPKPQWLEQFDTHTLRIESLDWDEIDVRTYGYRMVAIAIGRLTQIATYARTPAGGQFRVTAILLRDGPRWRVAAAHYSRIAARGSPQ
jgi:ketosteroid isomerase-like protein